MKITERQLRRIIREAMEHPKQYGAPEGSTRDKQLDQTQADLKKAKKLRKKGKAGQAKELEQRAYARRDRMEKKEREKNESLTLVKALVEARYTKNFKKALQHSHLQVLEKVCPLISGHMQE